MMSADSTPKSMVLWVPWTPPSENVVRTRHWSKNHAESKAAKEAWLSAFRSSVAAVEFWTAITLQQGANLLETPSPDTSDSMTPTTASLGNTDKSRQTENKA